MDLIRYSRLGVCLIESYDYFDYLFGILVSISVANSWKKSQWTRSNSTVSWIGADSIDKIKQLNIPIRLTYRLYKTYIQFQLCTKKEKQPAHFWDFMNMSCSKLCIMNCPKDTFSWVACMYINGFDFAFPCIYMLWRRIKPTIVQSSQSMWIALDSC